jgi:hypothetical protein
LVISYTKALSPIALNENEFSVRMVRENIMQTAQSAITYRALNSAISFTAVSISN